MRIAAALLALLPATGQAAGLSHSIYICDREIKLDVVYVQSDGPDQAVVMAEGHIAMLSAVPSAEGKRYRNSHVVDDYVWWVRDREAMLGWYDADTGTETVVFQSFRRVSTE
jgi:membrane-bound inhibitor of C-type lysozyme